MLSESYLPSVLTQMLECEEYGTGAQVFAWGLGTSLSFALGTDHLGRPMREDQLHSTFCLTKPLVALALGLCVDGGLVEYDDPVARFLGTRVTHAVPIGDVLCHRAGMHHRTAAQYRMANDTQLVEYQTRFEMMPGVCAYSDYTAWAALCEALRVIVGAPAEEFIAREILQPLGLHEEIVYPEPRQFDVLAESMGVSVGGLPAVHLPLLSERIPSELLRTRAPLGALTTARAVGRLYVRLLQCLDGDEVQGLPTPETLRRSLTLKRGVTYDVTLQRECDFGGGFMIDMARHGVCESVSPLSFGHSAGICNAVAFADPADGVAVSFMLNGILLDLDVLFKVRTALAQSLLAAITP